MMSTLKSFFMQISNQDAIRKIVGIEHKSPQEKYVKDTQRCLYMHTNFQDALHQPCNITSDNQIFNATDSAYMLARRIVKFLLLMKAT